MAPTSSSDSCCAPATAWRYLAGLKRPVVAQTPRDLVWRATPARLWRYRSDGPPHPRAAS